MSFGLVSMGLGLLRGGTRLNGLDVCWNLVFKHCLNVMAASVPGLPHKLPVAGRGLCR